MGDRNSVSGQAVSFATGETIHTSRKYDIDRFEDLARTAGQLQELVMRFHAEVGTDAAIEAAYGFEPGDEADYDVTPRRRGDDWGQSGTGHGYASRAS